MTNKATAVVCPFPGLLKAIILMAYDNGGITRERSEQAVVDEFNEWLVEYSKEVSQAQLVEVDAWLAKLNPDALNIVCCGEESEQMTLLEDAPTITENVLNDLFDEVV